MPMFRSMLTICLILCAAPCATAGPALPLLLIDSVQAPVTLGSDGSLSLVAGLASVTGDGTPLHDFGGFPVSGGSVALSFGPATSGTLATGFFYSGGTLTLTGNGTGHVLVGETFGPTELAPRTDTLGQPFYVFDTIPGSSTLAPELAAFFGVRTAGSSMLAGSLQSVGGVLTAVGGIQAGGVVTPLPATGAVPEPASVLLLAVGLAVAAWLRPRPTAAARAGTGSTPSPV
jgi:PEP-CTERM motif